MIRSSDYNRELMPDEQTPVRKYKWVGWGFVCLALACVLAKGMQIGWPARFTWFRVWEWVLLMRASVQADLVFVAVAAGIGLGLARAVRRWQRVRIAVEALLAAFLLASILYALAVIPYFAFTRSFPTATSADVLGWSGHWKIAGMPARMVWVMVLAPVLSLLIITAGMWLFPPRPTRRIWPAAVLIIVYGAILGGGAIKSWKPKGFEQRLADSPHLVLLRSCFQSWPSQAGSYPPTFASDFVASQAPNLPRGPKNVIVVVLESVATRYLSLYGSSYPTTPNLQREAHHAAVFEAGYSIVTNTSNSLYGLLLSKYPPPTYQDYFADHLDTPGRSLAAELRGHGYRTAYITSGKTQWAKTDQFLKTRGFDVLKDYRDTNLPMLVPDWGWGVDDKAMVDMTCSFIDSDRTRPFFVLCWNQATHYPFTPYEGDQRIDFLHGTQPKDDYDLGFKENYYSALNEYLNAIHHVDEQLGKLFAFLRQRGLADDTLVVLLGDHGEAFGYPHPFYGHSGKVYQEDLNIPFVLWSPRLYSHGSRPKNVVGMVDVGPTILDVLGFQAPAGWIGHSALSPEHPGRTYFFGSKDAYLLGLRDGPFKFICNTTTGVDELYDLSADPLEQKNLSSERPNLVRQYRQRIAAWVHSACMHP